VLEQAEEHEDELQDPIEMTGLRSLVIARTYIPLGGG
jgi:hypothetical protein